MKNNRIWLSSPHMGGNEQKYVEKAFAANWIAPLGPDVDAFEQALSDYLGSGHVSALSSGTAALHLSLLLAGVLPGDEVLCQSFTFTASANPVVYAGAVPVFVDSEPATWNMCPDLLEEAIRDRIKKGKKPAACIVVHLYGMPAQMEEIAGICRRYEILLIEDAAEALGSVYYGRKAGTLSDYSVLSFNGNKIITTSGGGALICRDENKAEKAKFLATQARDPAPHYEHSEIGYNYRMSNVSAAIGRGQMEVLDEHIRRRRENNRFYTEWLGTTGNIHFLAEPEGFYSNRWLTCAVFEDHQQREAARRQLSKNDIESRPLWKPMHLQPVFKDCPAYVNGISADLFDKGLCLPSGSNLTYEDIHRVGEGVLAGLKIRDFS